MMKHAWLTMILALLSSGSALMAAESYEYSVFVFEPTRLYCKPTRRGSGTPDICKWLFLGPQTYNGPVIEIPEDAVAFGVVVVTTGKKAEAIPLYRWTDKKGTERFGCNGPNPYFARFGKTRKELVEAIVATLEATPKQE